MDAPMEANVISRESNAIELSLSSREGDLVAAPQDYFLAPIFAASRQSGPREVTVRVNIDGKVVERRYFMGGFHPLRPNHPPPALDVRHGRAIFALLSFRDPFDETR